MVLSPWKSFSLPILHSSILKRCVATCTCNYMAHYIVCIANDLATYCLELVTAIGLHVAILGTL